MSTARLYRLWFDSRDRAQWFLGDPKDASGREVHHPYTFTRGQRLEVPDGLVVPVDNAGHALDFSFGSFDMPVVTEPVGALLDAMAAAGVQRIPVRVEGRSERYEILNVVTVIDCIDRDRTIGDLWTEEDCDPEEDGDAEEIGGYRMVFELRLDPGRVGGARIFRPAGWLGVVAVTEDVKLALEDAKVTGLSLVIS